MSALGASISGLQSSQKWLDVISNNISNSNTVGFKSGQLNFADLVSSSITSPSGPDAAANLGGINPSQLGLGVTVGSIQTIMSEGAIQTTGVVTDVAINGSGFLTVKSGDSSLYTRAGNLTFDQAGNLTTSDGGLVQGWEAATTVTPLAGSVAAAAGDTSLTITGPVLNTSNVSAVGNIVIPQNLVLAPKATSYNANSSVKDQGVILSGNLDNATPMNPVAALTPYGYVAFGAASNGYVPDATQTFTTYDSLGNAHVMEMSWIQTANTAGGAAPAKWNWSLNDITGGKTPNGSAWVAGGPGNQVATGTGVVFNADGSLATLGAAGINATIPAGATTYDIALNLPNGAVGTAAPYLFNFSINIGTPNIPGAPPTLGLRDGMTGDYGNGTTNTLGVYTPVQTAYTKLVDGYPEGTLTGLSFNSTGGVSASFSNGQNLVIAQLAISTFTNPDGLSRVGGNYYAATANSGLGQIGTAGANGAGTIQGGALEGSNVDLTVELTNMILAQRMFESNAKVITTASSLLSTLINAVPAQ